LILRKIVKIVATRCHILRLKCTKFDFDWSSAPNPAGGAHSTPQDPLAGFKQSYFPEGKGRTRGGEGKGRRGRREGRGGEGKEVRGREEISLTHGRLRTLAALFILWKIIKFVRLR